MKVCGLQYDVNRDEFIILIIEKFYTPEFILETCFE